MAETEKTSIQITKETHRRLKQAALDDNCSVFTMTERILQESLARIGK